MLVTVSSVTMAFHSIKVNIAKSMTEKSLKYRPVSSVIGGLRPIFPYLKPYYVQLAGAILALIMTTFMTLLMGQALRYLIDQGFRAQSFELLQQGIIWFSIPALILASATFARSYLVSWIGERISNDLRVQAFRHIILLDPAFFESHLASNIQARLTTDITILQTVIGSSVSIATRSLIMCVGALALMLYTSLKLTLLILLSVPLILLPLILLGRKIRALSKTNQGKLADLGGYVMEVVRHIKAVKANLHEKHDVLKFTEHSQATFDVAVHRIRMRAALIALVMLMVLSAIAAMLWVGGQDVMMGAITPGELIAFIFYAFMLVFSVTAVSEVYSDLQRAAGAIERLLELLAVQPELTVPTNAAILPASFVYVLEFDQVCHRYPSRRQHQVLNGISFCIAPNEHVALVGHSGAGKSTLFELILRFYDPTSGIIRFGDTDIRTLSHVDLRSQITLVPQKPALFNGTIRDNIAYAKVDASEDEITTAAAMAHVLEFTERLPDGLATRVGDDGMLLSGGQRQRIAIARAILNQPRLLLLDEATNSLDAESEHIVQAALAELMATTATLVIAHRLVTVRNANRILLFAEGELVASGTHQQLVEQSPFYARLVKLQFDPQGHDNASSDKLATDQQANARP